MLSKFFYPDEYVKSIMNIDYDKLRAREIHGLIFDIDNTIVGYNTFEIPGEIIKLFGDLSDKRFELCFLSNNKKKRVMHFCQSFNIHGFHTALKPTPFGFIKAVKYLGIPKKNLAIIGDQIFTDVICGRMQNIYTILVEPIVERTDFINKFKRNLELIILNSKK